MFQAETSACIDALEEVLGEPQLEICFVGPGDLAMSMGLRTRDSILRFMDADELKWCFRYIVKTCATAGKIAGGFTRDGNPSSLLSYGFRMVALSADLMDAMTGAQSILTGTVRIGGATVKTGRGLTRLKGWSRNPSKLIPTAGFLYTKVVPSVLRHLWSVKGWRASSTLVLPNVMHGNPPETRNGKNQPFHAEPTRKR
jgi:hypothetical protein